MPISPIIVHGVRPLSGSFSYWLAIGMVLGVAAAKRSLNPAFHIKLLYVVQIFLLVVIGSFFAYVLITTRNLRDARCRKLIRPRPFSTSTSGFDRSDGDPIGDRWMRYNWKARRAERIRRDDDGVVRNRTARNPAEFALGDEWIWLGPNARVQVRPLMVPKANPVTGPLVENGHRSILLASTRSLCRKGEEAARSARYLFQASLIAKSAILKLLVGSRGIAGTPGAPGPPGARGVIGEFAQQIGRQNNVITNCLFRSSGASRLYR